MFSAQNSLKAEHQQVSPTKQKTLINNGARLKTDLTRAHPPSNLPK